MVITKIDNIKFKLKEYQDFLWIKKYGTLFSVIDETGSGCICFGLKNGTTKYFLKIAGAYTIEAEVTPEESITVLKKAITVYEAINHPNLIKLIGHYPYLNYYVAVFEWVDGDCLFDHWNFEKYSKNSKLISPAKKFKALPTEKKINAINVMFSFLETVSNSGFIAVDFYDGSIIYDFNTDTTTICDIDFFRKKPTINDMGESFFGTKRLKSPEEYTLNASIDETTNIFTLGAMIFDFFGEFTNKEIEERYINNRFTPCSFDKWQLNKSSYDVVLKAVNLDKSERYKSISEFHSSFKLALNEDVLIL